MPTVDRKTGKWKKEWKDSYSVGIEEIDIQHRRLLELINEVRNLADSMAPPKSSCFLALNAMVQYAESHFKTEEGFMERFSFRGFAQHKEMHDIFLEDVFSMVQPLEEDRLSLRQISIYLEDWYEDHVLGTDQNYKAFLTAALKDRNE